ncbi:hypothetical protein ANO14919_145890 [Xylariales sp. No.14919]|nr:hypothetical protein ANO14919_145890 [Xylariales sp. No.14919]
MSDQERLPSYEDLRRALKPPPHTPEADRIFWTVDGPLHSSVWIMSRGSLKPYAQRTDESNPTWHPISQCPLTEPKVSSITVEVHEIDRWESNWVEEHSSHMDPPEPGEPLSGDGFRYGPLPDYGPDLLEEPLSEEQPLYLLECCDQPRPLGKTFKVVVQPSPGNEFVTIHDYLSTLHPLLLESRDDIIASLCLTYDRQRPAEPKLLVNHNYPKKLSFLELSNFETPAFWVNSTRRTRPCSLVDDD